jgi:hypothetical protein
LQANHRDAVIDTLGAIRSIGGPRQTDAHEYNRGHCDVLAGLAIESDTIYQDLSCLQLECMRSNPSLGKTASESSKQPTSQSAAVENAKVPRREHENEPIVNDCSNDRSTVRYPTPSLLPVVTL